MATETLLLTSVVAGSDHWSLDAGANKVSACNPPDDDATSYISSGTTNNTEQRFALADPADILSSDTINKVTLRVRHRRAGTPAGTIQGFLVTSGGTVSGTSTATGASWASVSNDFNEKPGGGAWTLAALNELVVGVKNTTNGRSVHCSTLEVVVDYTPVRNDLVGQHLQGPTPAVGSGTVGQVFALEGAHLEGPTPGVGTGEVGQTFALEGADLQGPTPSVGTGEVGQVFELVGVDLEGPTPAVGSGTVDQDLGDNALSGQHLRGPTPAVGAGSIGQTFNLEGLPLEGPMAAVGSGAIDQAEDNQLIGSHLEGPTPAVGTGQIGQVSEEVEVTHLRGLVVTRTALAGLVVRSSERAGQVVSVTQLEGVYRDS